MRCPVWGERPQPVVPKPHLDGPPLRPGHWTDRQDLSVLAQARPQAGQPQPRAWGSLGERDAEARGQAREPLERIKGTRVTLGRGHSHDSRQCSDLPIGLVQEKSRKSSPTAPPHTHSPAQHQTREDPVLSEPSPLQGF